MSIATYDLASLTYDSATTSYDGGGVGLSNMPVVGVFISFTDGPYVVEPNWVEVTQYVRDINVRRGRGNDLQQFPTGSATVTLDNRTRLFDPFNTAGTYYGNLKPRRQIKIVGQWLGVTYPIFRGFIAGWPVGYTDGGKDSTVEIDCFDALGLLATETIIEDPLEVFTLSLLPMDYWKLNDVSTTLSLKNYIRNNPLVITQTGNNWSSLNPVVNTLKGNSASVRLADTVSTTTTYATESLSICCWALNFGVGSSSSGNFQIQKNANQLAVIASPSGVRGYFLTSTSFASGTERTTNTIAVDTKNPHFYCATWDGTTIRLYIDGVLQTTTMTSTAISGQTAVDSARIADGTFQEFSAFNKVLTSAQIASLYQFSSLSIPETSTARENRIMANSSFPSALQSFPASPTTTVSELSTNSTVTNDLQRVVLSEGGELFVSSSGVLTSTNREYFGATRSAVSQMSFVDTSTGVYYDHASIRMKYDADDLRNSIEIQFSNGGSIVNTDATSLAAYGEAGESRSTIIADLDSATALASRLVTIYKNPKLRIEPFVVKGQRNPTYDWPRLLALELLDRFTLVRTPSTGSAISQDMLLQSIEHRITPGSWETVVNGSARFTGWFTIGTSLIGGTDVLL